MGETAPGVRDAPVPPAAPTPAGRRGHGVWFWPAALTAAICAVQLDRAPLWRDELATWSAATRPAGDLLRLAGNIDAVSGPYYLVMHGWTAIFGDSVPVLRLPSLLCMTGAAALTAVLGRRLSGPRVGLLAGLLLAVAPSTSRYGQEARSYALATLLAVGSTVLLFGALDRPGRLRWLGYGTALTGLGLVHLIAFTLVAGHAVAVLVTWHRTRDRRLAGFLVAVAAAVLVLTPLAALGRGQQGRQLDWVGRPGALSLSGLPGSLLQSGTVGGMLFGLAAVGAAGRGRWGAVLGLSALLPVGLLFAIGLATPVWVPRYVVFVVPFVCLLAAEALAPLRLPTALAVVAAAALLGAPEQVDLRRTHEWPRSAAVDYPAALRIVADHRRPGDGIVYLPRNRWAFLDTATEYYLRNDAPRDVLRVRGPVQRADLWSTECPRPQRCLAMVDRVWVLARGERDDPLVGMPADRAGPLRAGFRTERVWTVPGLTVALLAR